MIDYSYVLSLAKGYAIRAYKDSKKAGNYNSADYWKNVTIELSKMQREYCGKEVTT